MPLLIYGARQVGKTFEMREFGALYYKNTVYVNFETDERIGKYFDTDIHADYIIAILEKYYQVKIVPENTAYHKTGRACGYTDLRKGIDGLARLVQQQFALDPFTNPR